MFQGVYAALFTPFDAEGEVAEPLLRTHIDFLISRGLDGLYVCGNSGQGLYLSTAERKRVLEIVKDQAAGRVKIIAHVGGTLATRDARDLVGHANALGVDAVASLPPIYWNYTADEIVQYYRDINRDNNLPCFIYHIPQLAGAISRDTMLRIGEIEQIKGLKFTDTDFFALQDLLQRMEGRWIAFSGPDQLFLPALTMGVVGSIGSTQNIFPEIFTAIYKAFRAGDLERARELQAAVTRILGCRSGGAVLTAHRSLLKLRGIDPGLCRPPLTPDLDPIAEQALHAAVRTALAACPLLENILAL